MKCKELAAEYNVTPMQVGRLRKRLFHDCEGSEVTDEQALAIREYFDESIDERESMSELVKPRFVDAFCTYAQKGRQEVECEIRISEGQVEKVRALIPFKADSMTLHFRPMRLEVIEYEGEKFYRHESLAGKAWDSKWING